MPRVYRHYGCRLPGSSYPPSLPRLPRSRWGLELLRLFAWFHLFALLVLPPVPAVVYHDTCPRWFPYLPEQRHNHIPYAFPATQRRQAENPLLVVWLRTNFPNAVRTTHAVPVAAVLQLPLPPVSAGSAWFGRQTLLLDAASTGLIPTLCLPNTYKHRAGLTFCRWFADCAVSPLPYVQLVFCRRWRFPTTRVLDLPYWLNIALVSAAFLTLTRTPYLSAVSSPLVLPRTVLPTCRLPRNMVPCSYAMVLIFALFAHIGSLYATNMVRHRACWIFMLYSAGTPLPAVLVRMRSVLVVLPIYLVPLIAFIAGLSALLYLLPVDSIALLTLCCWFAFCV